MVFFRYWIGILYILASCCFSQTTISGRFVGLNMTDLDPASVLIKEGTGDTTYACASASKDGSFYLKTDHVGTLMAEFTCPRFKTLQAALLCDKPTRIKVDVTLRGSSDAHDKSRLAFHDSLSLLAKYALLHFESTRRLARKGEERVKLSAEGRAGEENSIDWSDDTRAIEKALGTEKEPLLRQELIIQYDELDALGASSISEDSLKKWIIEIPPTSPAWVYHSNLASTSSLVLRRDGIQYVNDIIARHANMYFRARMLYELARWACAMRDDKHLDSLITELTDKYSNTKWATQARLLLPVIRVGDPVPHFELRSIDDSSTIFSEKNMLGRPYLIDFWATWCSPCVGQMPYLHKAYERFRSHGFTILSVSSDDSIKTVSMYRKRKWAMPWLNALESSQPDGTIRWSFGVWGIPFPVLVNAQGIITALGDDLKGEDLEITLERLIKK
jgi:thiol-disulfide isomerase/thioredoxin